MNAAGFPILSLITWLPLVGCAVIMAVRGDEETVASNARWTALWTSLIVFGLSLLAPFANQGMGSCCCCRSSLLVSPAVN